MVFHNSLGVGSIHIPYEFTYANAAARVAATPDAADIGKFARQADNNGIWMLTGVSPTTWVAVSGGAVLDGYVSEDAHNADIAIIEAALDGYALVVTEDQRWVDSSQQRQDLRDACDAYGASGQGASLDGYALVVTEDQRWVDSSQQRQDLRDAADGYGDDRDTNNQRWVDSSQQRQDLRDACDAYGASGQGASLDGYALVVTWR